MLILASTSPRRREVLNFFSIPFQLAKPDFDEESVEYLGDPKKHVMDISKGKAMSLRDQYPTETILAADTLVFFKDHVLGKPKNIENAFEILKQLRGQWHTVFTGITLIKGDKIVTDYDETRILFKDCTDQEIRKYIDGISCLDRAGAYAIQMAGNIMVEKLEGCFYNTVGLPINALERGLKILGINLWDYLKKESSSAPSLF